MLVSAFSLSFFFILLLPHSSTPALLTSFLAHRHIHFPCLSSFFLHIYFAPSKVHHISVSATSLRSFHCEHTILNVNVNQMWKKIHTLVHVLAHKHKSDSTQWKHLFVLTPLRQEKMEWIGRETVEWGWGRGTIGACWKLRECVYACMNV